MKIDELMQKLRKIRKDHGNVEVIINNVSDVTSAFVTMDVGEAAIDDDDTMALITANVKFKWKLLDREIV